MGATNPQRLWARVIITPGCWLWTGRVNKDGYGQLNWRGKTGWAHHVSLELDGRPRPDGMETDHSCRTRNCVNPDHLSWVTHRVNIQRIPKELLGTGNRSKTVCKKGHEFTEENTRIYVKPDGSSTRICLECQKVKAKALYDQRKEEGYFMKRRREAGIPPRNFKKPR